MWGISRPRFEKDKLYAPDIFPVFLSGAFESGRRTKPSHPFGVKAVAEIPMDGVAPAVGNAIMHAVGTDLSDNPATPERVWRALRA